MKNIKHLTEEERKHFEMCTCGEYFDCRDLGQVMDHLHMDRSVTAHWSFSVKVGEPEAYPKKGNKLDLN